MQAFKYSIAIFCAAALWCACNFNPKPLDIDIEEPEQHMVISSFAVPPQELAVIVTRSFSALLGEDSIDLDDQNVADRVFVDSALVILRYAGRVDTLYKLAPSVYGSISAEQIPNEKYTLTVKDFKTGEEVVAETTLLPTVSLDTVYPVQRIFPNLDDTLNTFKFSFTDVPGIENYYLATYTNLNQLQGSFSNISSSVFKFTGSQFNTFTDKNNGDGKAIDYQPETLSFLPGDTVVVALSNVPVAYYNYLSAYKRSGNLLSQIVGEPINLPTNVQGGFGYFAMIKPSVRIVILR